jgi:hypothetical protein
MVNKNCQKGNLSKIVLVLLITLVSITFLPVRTMGDLHRFDTAESKYGNKIAPPPTMFEREIF